MPRTATKTKKTTRTVLSIRIDSSTKKAVDDFATSIGLSVSAFVTVTLKQALQQNQVTLTPAKKLPSLKPTPYLEKIMRESKAEYLAGKNVTTVNNNEELEAYFNSL